MHPNVASFVLFVATAAAVPVLEALVKVDHAALGDWRSWAIGVGLAAVRAAAGAALARLVEARLAPHESIQPDPRDLLPPRG